MLHKGYISSGYLIKNNGNPILATHSIFSEHDVAMLFISFLNMHNVNNEYFERIKESIISEFNNK